MNETTNTLERIPLTRWAMRHPRLAAWIVLSVGMVVLITIQARDVGLLPTQWLALLVATVLVAGACVWIISWEDADEEDEDADSEASVSEPDSDPTSPIPPEELRD